jgi:hypothetical protein
MHDGLHLHYGLLPAFLPELPKVHLDAERGTNLESCMKLTTLWIVDMIRWDRCLLKVPSVYHG